MQEVHLLLSSIKIYDELLETLPVSSFIANYATASKQDKQYAKNLRDYVFSAKAE